MTSGSRRVRRLRGEPLCRELPERCPSCLRGDVAARDHVGRDLVQPPLRVDLAVEVAGVLAAVRVPISGPPLAVGALRDRRHPLTLLVVQRPLADWEAEAGRLRDVLDAVAADNVRRHERQTPQWLVDTLGAPPEHPEIRAVWREAATRIGAFRVRWQIDDPDHALGPPPVSDAQGRDRAELVSHLRQAVRQVTSLDQPEAERALAAERRLSRGISR